MLEQATNIQIFGKNTFMSSGYPKMDVYNETPYLVFLKSLYYLYTIRYDKVMRCKQAGNDFFWRKEF